ncbi:hypothetical protein CP03DC29_0753, partial [Chlamydia psittaci 03DC29]
MSNPQAAKVFLGVDYGEKRIGLAYASSPLCISLPIGFIATGKTLEATAKLLVGIIQERNVSTVVLGNPIPMQKGQKSALQE